VEISKSKQKLEGIYGAMGDSSNKPGKSAHARVLLLAHDRSDKTVKRTLSQDSLSLREGSGRTEGGFDDGRKYLGNSQKTASEKRI